MSIKPILMNAEMVRALLDGRKTVTRRVLKPQHLRVLDSEYHREHPEVSDKTLIEKLCEPPYRPGDILYVRETWTMTPGLYGEFPQYLYRANFTNEEIDGILLGKAKWQPSIHMPREAARIFLRVTDVRVERLQDIECIATEGIGMVPADNKRDPRYYFAKLWDSTIKPADRPLYGWAVDPWVWVTEFERCGKPNNFDTPDTAGKETL